MSYRHLTLEQRYQIAALQRAGVSQQHSAQETGCHSSTVSRALRRNCSGKIYVGSIGHGQATQRRHAASSHAHLSDAVRLELIARLKQDHSPNQIRGRLKLLKGGVVSHTTSTVTRDSWGYAIPNVAAPTNSWFGDVHSFAGRFSQVREC